MKQLNFTQSDLLHQDSEGTIRVKGSRITLDTLVGTFNKGETVEEIQDGFPSLSLSQIQGVIAWYIENQDDADEYLNERAAEAETLKRMIESRFDHAAFVNVIRQRQKQLIKS